MTLRALIIGRHGEVAVEILGLALAAAVGKADDPGAALFRRSGFVETNLSVLSKTDYKEVEPPYGLVVFGAVFGDLVAGDGGIRDMDIFLRDVHMVEQLAEETAVAALGLVGAEGIVFVYGIDLDVGKGDEAFAVTAGQPLVEGNGRGAGGQAEAERAVLPCRLEISDRIDYDIGDTVARAGGVGIDFRRNFFKAVENAFGKVLFNQSAVLR